MANVTAGDVMIVAGSITVVGGALTLLWKLMLGPLWKISLRMNEFLDDWFGVPDRDGVPGRKGVMHRLNEVEISKVDRDELADLVAVIAQKADRNEVLALREALDDHIRRMDTVHGTG